MKKRILPFFLFVLPLSMVVLLSNACEKEAICEEVIETNTACTQQYDPVCGCNNVTYGNACMAEARGIRTYTKGACPK